MISCLSQEIGISEKKNSNFTDFHETLEAEENVWMKDCAYCWTSLSAAFTAAAIIAWRVLTWSLKKRSCLKVSEKDSVVMTDCLICDLLIELKNSSESCLWWEIVSERKSKKFDCLSDYLLLFLSVRRLNVNDDSKSESSIDRTL